MIASLCRPDFHATRLFANNTKSTAVNFSEETRFGIDATTILTHSMCVESATANQQTHRLAVIGTHHSGKSYTSRILYELGFRHFLQEPLNPFSPPGVWLGKTQCTYTYCDTQSPPAKQAMIERKLFGVTGLPLVARPRTLRNYASLWKAALVRLGLWHSRKSFVIKDPFCLFAADFLHTKLGISPWIIIRHPGDFVANSLRKGIPADFSSFEGDPEFADRLGEEYKQLKQYAENPDHRTLFHRNLVYWILCAQIALRSVSRWKPDSRYAFNLLDTLNENPLGAVEGSLRRLGCGFTRQKVAEAIKRASGQETAKNLHRLHRSAEAALSRPEPTERLKPLTPEMLAELDRMTAGVYKQLKALELRLLPGFEVVAFD